MYKFFLAILLLSFKSIAIDHQEYLLLHNSNHCSNYFSHFEQKYSIPQHLLRSISVVETGRWYNKGKLYLPWPWAVNQAGKSYYFSSKKEAIEAVKKMLEMGKTNIDIGCMQINLHHHPDAFINLNQAFEPKDNIEYAATFLKSHYNQSKNWQKAVASYHSLADIGQAYANKVIKIWSDYKENKLNYSYCTSSKGEIIACNSSGEISEESVNFYSDDIKNNVEINKAKKTRKESKRLRSSIILYSSSKE
jgi:hypothetical protein